MPKLNVVENFIYGLKVLLLDGKRAVNSEVWLADLNITQISKLFPFSRNKENIWSHQMLIL